MNLINQACIDAVAQISKESPKQRDVHTFHQSYAEHIQRFINVIQPESIVKIHKHTHTDETIIALQGRIKIMEYTDEGKVCEEKTITPTGDCKGVIIPKHTWHALQALDTDSALFIVMEGPYQKETHKIIAPWQR